MSIVSVHSRLTLLPSGYSGLRRTGPVRKVFERMAVGTQEAVTVLERNQDLHQPIMRSLKPHEPRIALIGDLRLEHYHGRTDIYYGARLVRGEDKLFKQAKAGLFDHRSKTSRDLFFRMMGIKTVGVNELAPEKCLKLGGWLKWYRLVRATPLLSISSITIVNSDENIVPHEDQLTNEGWEIRISKGDLAQMTDEAWVNERVLSDTGTGPEA